MFLTGIQNVFCSVLKQTKFTTNLSIVSITYFEKIFIGCFLRHAKSIRCTMNEAIVKQLTRHVSSNVKLLLSD